MSSRYTADGKRRSSQTHAGRGHTCELCGAVSFGNGGKVSHGRVHVRRGEAVELYIDHGWPPISHRVFLAPDATETIARFIRDGYSKVER